MRRSLAVKLTLLPMLASAAVAAQPAAPEESSQQLPDVPGDVNEPIVSPPGLTPTIDECWQAPDAPGCARVLAPDAPGAQDPQDAQDAQDDDNDPRGLCIDDDCWVFRGGFGHYFWTAGG